MALAAVASPNHLMTFDGTGIKQEDFKTGNTIVLSCNGSAVLNGWNITIRRCKGLRIIKVTGRVKTEFNGNLGTSVLSAPVEYTDAERNFFRKKHRAMFVPGDNRLLLR